MADDEENKQPIIIKNIKKGGGHHGGAWKVAYADFVTAMMAFFLLLWLLNVTTEDQKNAISNYFDPTHPKVSDTASGAGGVLGGISMSPKGAMTSSVQPITPAAMVRRKPSHDSPEEKAKEAKRQEEQQRFDRTAERLRQAIQDAPELAELARNLIVDMTPEGLRIQIVDQEGRPMFPSGSAQPFEVTQRLLREITNVVDDMPNDISIRGHTDAIPYGPGATYTNWELSSDRANASRRVMLESGLEASRLNNVVGKAATEPLIEDDPRDARNRRISIILLKEELTDPQAYENLDTEGFEGEAGGQNGNAPPELRQAPVGTFRRTPGNVEFP